MRSDVRLVGLAVEAFRGFRDRQEFDLDASTVILTGPNGTGKTSVFDAVQWVLVGSIERLEGLRARRNVEHVVSSYRSGDRARVELTLRVDRREVIVRRTGDYRESTLEVLGATAKALYGDAAADWLGHCLLPREPAALDMVLTTCGLLQQDVMRSVLEAKPADRYAHITTVLGLQGLEDFEDATRTAAKEAGDQRSAAEQERAKARSTVEAASTLVETLEQRALQRVSVSVAREEVDRLVAEAPGSLTALPPPALDFDTATGLARDCRELAAGVRQLIDAVARISREKEHLAPVVGDGQIQQLMSGLKDASSALEAERAAQEAALLKLSAAEQATEEMSRLAAAAIPLLSTDCPVCGQSIDPDAVADRLRSLGSESDTLVELKSAVDRLSARLSELTAERDARQSELDGALQSNARWKEYEERRIELRDRIASKELLRSGPFSIGGLELESGPESGAEVLAWLERFRDAVEGYAEVVRESQSAGEIDRARAELASAQQVLDERMSHADRLSTRAARLKQLADAASQARVDVTKERFQAIEPLVLDIYGRLDPHPAFKMIGFDHETYYGKGTSTPVVRDLVAGVNADPLIVFSASQANIAALSYFLAMSLGAGERALPFVLLDDPLQSMDDVNVLGFADLCRFIRSERQLVISTHDSRFAGLLGRKLTPRTPQEKTILYRFEGWDRRGPSVSRELLQDELHDSPLRLVVS